MNEFFRVGVIASAHGIRGEVNVYPTTDDPTRFEELDEVLLQVNNRKVPYAIEQVKYFKKMVILKLKGINTRNDSEILEGVELYVPRDQALELDEGEYFIADLIGLEIWTDEGEKFGTLKDVMKTGANDVYVVRCDTDGKEYLFPVTEECVLDVDPEAGKITVHILDGLLDL